MDIGRAARGAGVFPDVRLRRLRRSKELRDMVAQPIPAPARFLYPVFLVEGRGVREPIASMPGQFRWSVDRLEEALAPCAAAGVGGVLLFGAPSAGRKTPGAEWAWAADGLVQSAIAVAARAFPGLLVFTDVCVCAYTSDGQCGVHAGGEEVANDATLEALCRMALSHARAGADGVAPSAMMDGQVGAIRRWLDAAGFHNTLLMAYSTKFASSMYGPFRDAAGSAPGKGDRSGHQCDFRDLRGALRESALDAAEGADILMVKPALFYLDVIKELRGRLDLPLAAYNVSGEYAMLSACAERGWGGLREMVRESMHALSRAGADIIISYWASRYAELIAD